MARIVVTAEVQDGAKWEETFRTHAELFRSMTATSIHYAVLDDNHVAVYADVEDKAKYFEILESQATVDAMGEDGVKRETVKVFALDRDLAL